MLAVIEMIGKTNREIRRPPRHIGARGPLGGNRETIVSDSKARIVERRCLELVGRVDITPTVERRLATQKRFERLDRIHRTRGRMDQVFRRCLIPLGDKLRCRGIDEAQDIRGVAVDGDGAADDVSVAPIAERQRDAGFAAGDADLAGHEESGAKAPRDRAQRRAIERGRHVARRRANRRRHAGRHDGTQDAGPVDVRRE